MIETRLQHQIAILQMQHGKVNALDTEFCQALIDCFAELQSSDVRAVVLTGTGTTFSAGVDLLRLLDGGPDYSQVFIPILNELFEVVFDFPKPLVAAVNGHAIAGGCVLACSGDHRIMAIGSGRMGIPELHVGVPFPTLALEIMRLISPPQHFQELFYGGATVLPDEALKRGLVDELVEPTQLMDRAQSVAEHFLEIPAPAFALTKRQIRQPLRERDQDVLKRFEATVSHLWAQPETHAAIRAYSERTFKKS